MKVKAFISIILLVLISSCGVLSSGSGSTYSVLVNSFVRPDLQSYRTHLNNKFILVPLVEGLDPNDFEYLEYAEYVKRLMISRGYEFVYNKEHADIAIGIYFEVSAPQTQLSSYVVPIVSYEAGQTYNFQSTTYGRGYSNTTGSITTPGKFRTDYQQVTKKTTNYTRRIILDSYDYKKFRESKGETSLKLWTVEGISTGQNGDMRIVAPAMIASMNQFIERNSGRQTKLSIRDNNRLLISLREGQLYQSDRLPSSSSNPVDKVFKRADYCSPLEKLVGKKCD